MKTMNIEVKNIEFANEFVRFQHTADKKDFTDKAGSLANSINAVGLLNPIIVIPSTKGKYICIAGNRRLYATSKILKAKTIEAQILPKDSDSFAVALTENIQREDLTPLEIGKWVTIGMVQSGAKLRDMNKEDKDIANKTITDVAKRTGLSDTRIRELARTWQRATPKQRDKVAAKKMSSDKLVKEIASQKPKPKKLDSLIKSTQKRIPSVIIGKGSKDINALYNRLVFVSKNMVKICADEKALHALEKICSVCALIQKDLNSME